MNLGTLKKLKNKFKKKATVYGGKERTSVGLVLKHIGKGIYAWVKGRLINNKWIFKNRNWLLTARIWFLG